MTGALVGAEHEQNLASLNPANGKVVGYAPNATIGERARSDATPRRVAY